MLAERIFETEWVIHNLHRKRLFNKLHKTFVDVGAGDGRHQSNSLAFIEMGWDALLIDGLQSNIDKCKRLHIARPFVKCVQAVVSDREEPVHFEVDSRFWALSGIDHDQEPNTMARTLSGILKAQKLRKVGVMSIDLEGHEAPILNDLVNNNIFPQVMIVEANELAQMYEHREILKDYYRVVGMIAPNEIYFRKDLKW